MLLALTTEEAAIWQHYDCSPSLEASFSELANSCGPDVFIHTALSSSTLVLNGTVHQNASL